MTDIPFRERLSCSIPEACVAIEVGRAKLYQEIAAGRIDTRKIGKRTLILVSSLERLLRVPAGTAACGSDGRRMDQKRRSQCLRPGLTGQQL